MKKNSRIYVAGHTGFIGSAIVQKLKEKGYDHVMVRSRKELDLKDQRRTAAFFKDAKPDYVFLFAAKTGGILANRMNPAQFIYDNLAIQNNVISAAGESGVKKLLFPGSTCMYPKFCRQPMKTEYLLTGPVEPTSEPFAVAKIAGIKLCQAYRRKTRAGFICAIPATVYGPGDHFSADGHVVSGLMEKFYRAVRADAPDRTVKIWGTGKPRREFIYVDDVARACIFLMEKYNDEAVVNIGTGEEVSVRDLAERIKTIANFKGRLEYEKDKPDGSPRRFMECGKIRAMGWKPKIKLTDGLSATYRWFRLNCDK